MLRSAVAVLQSRLRVVPTGAKATSKMEKRATLMSKLNRIVSASRPSRLLNMGSTPRR